LVLRTGGFWPLSAEDDDDGVYGVTRSIFYNDLGTEHRQG
jgi:hypothetical protein